MYINKLNNLNEKQKAFVREYSINWNATKAYQKAYGTTNEDVAGAAAARLLGNVRIQKYLKYCQDHVEELAHVSKIAVLNELKKIAFSSVADTHETWVTLKEFESLTDIQKSTIQVIESQTRHETVKGKEITVDWVKIKLYNKLEAIASINKMLGYNNPKAIEVTISDPTLKLMSTSELLDRLTYLKGIHEINAIAE